MIRKVVFLAIPALIFGLTPSASAATAKIGGTCTKVGATSTVKGKKLICAKSGKKFIWKLAPVKPIPVTPVIPLTPASQAKSGTRCDLPGVESFPEEGPLRCVDGKWVVVAQADDSVATRAFRSVLARYKANSEKALSLQFVVEPNSPEYLKSVSLGMLAGARLWAVPVQRDEPYPVLIGTNGPWLRQTSESMGLKSPEHSWTNIGRQYQCSYAEFKLEQGEKPWYLYCFAGNQANSLGFLQVGAHEYTHLAQFAFLSAFTDTSKREMAPWFQEGYASFIGEMLGFAANDRYDLRSLSVGEVKTVKTPLSDYQERFPPDWGDVYPMGTFAAEALTALYGIDVMEKVCAERAKGGTFNEAMIKITGKPVSAWTQIMQGYIDSVKSGTPWTLAELQKAAA